MVPTRTDGDGCLHMNKGTKGTKKSENCPVGDGMYKSNSTDTSAARLYY